MNIRNSFAAALRRLGEVRLMSPTMWQGLKPFRIWRERGAEAPHYPSRGGDRHG